MHDQPPPGWTREGDQDGTPLWRHQIDAVWVATSDMSLLRRLGAALLAARHPQSLARQPAGTPDSKEHHVRLIPIAACAAICVGVGLMLAACDGDLVPVNASPSPSYTTTPMSAPERCVAQVMGLLGESLQAMRGGYQNGIDASPVMAQYGTESAVYQTFVQAQGALAGDVITHGADGALTRIQPQVRERCAVAR